MDAMSAGRSEQGRTWVLAVGLGLAGLAIGGAAVVPATAPHGDLGAAYAALAGSPLGRDPHPVPARILTPLASWLVGLRGEAVVWTVLGACLLLAVLVARWALDRGSGRVGALLAAGFVAATLVVRTSLHAGAYPDVVTYLGLFGVWVWRARPRLASLCWLLALLDHERAVLMGPWVVGLLVLESRGEPRRRRWAWLGPVLAAGCWLALHLWLVSRRPAELTALAYLAPLRGDPWHNLRGAGALPLFGFWTALQWVWLVPALWTVRELRQGRWRGAVVQVGLPLLGAALAMLLAYDWSRMAALAFPCLLPGLAWLLGEAGAGGSRRGVRLSLAGLLLLQALWPQAFTAAEVIEVWSGWLLPWP
jgi:hypothetical protein